MARYSGRKATIEAYKRERKRVMNIIKELGDAGVSVPSSMIPQQGGTVKSKDVAKLKRMTRETIARKSEIVITERSPKGGRETNIYKGKDVLKVVRREKRKKSREVTKKIKEGKYYKDPMTGYVVDKSTGKTVAKRKSKKRKNGDIEGLEEFRKKVDEWNETHEYEDSTKFDFVDGSDYDFPELDPDAEYYDRFMEELGSFKLDPGEYTGRKPTKKSQKSSDNAERAADYIKGLLDDGIYDKGRIGAALRDMQSLGYSAEIAASYDDDVHIAFMSVLTAFLPSGSRYDMDTNTYMYGEMEEE